MKKTNPHFSDDIRPEYDFASMKGGVRGKYIARLREGTNLVLLDPDIAAAFPSEQAVNEALRAVINMSRAVRLPKNPLGTGARRRSTTRNRANTAHRG